MQKTTSITIKSKQLTDKFGTGEQENKIRACIHYGRTDQNVINKEQIVAKL